MVKIKLGQTVFFLENNRIYEKQVLRKIKIKSLNPSENRAMIGLGDSRYPADVIYEREPDEIFSTKSDLTRDLLKTS